MRERHNVYVIELDKAAMKYGIRRMPEIYGKFNLPNSIHTLRYEA